MQSPRLFRSLPIVRFDSSSTVHIVMCSRGPPSTFFLSGFGSLSNEGVTAFLRSAACAILLCRLMKKVPSTVSHTADNIRCVHTFLMEKCFSLSRWKNNERNGTSSTHGKRSFRCEIKKEIQQQSQQRDDDVKTRKNSRRENLDRGVMRQPHEIMAPTLPTTTRKSLPWRDRAAKSGSEEELMPFLTWP